ncbi:MAG: S-methyl-5-thioribose-1-phosphate isomerase [Candidatus Acidiferrum sp.]|jgi:methylthioribose-1-phosphate isomerase
MVAPALLRQLWVEVIWRIVGRGFRRDIQLTKESASAPEIRCLAPPQISPSPPIFATIFPTMYIAQPIEWTDRGVVMLDQRLLPTEEVHYTYTTYNEVASAITNMVIRGAPAIGVAAAMGAALGVLHSKAKSVDELRPEFAEICAVLAKTRPTAVDLFWAIDRMKAKFAVVIAQTSDLAKIRAAMVAEAQQVHLEKKATDEAMGRFGAELMPAEGRVMTQCNAGALATGGIGTALGVFRVAVEQGKKLHVLVPETRPYLQGARLTAWELHRGGIPLTLITDNMVGHFLKTGNVGAIVTGADRVAANGDAANKIGTYQIAVLAKENNVPFYIAAPVSTFDLSIPDGDHIPIEERSSDEVIFIKNIRIAPDVKAAHPAFDVTPARYITAIITERGIARAPYTESLRALANSKQAAIA